ncbi:hypothetical protein EE612_057250 [Oryza sativa]|nr:hypothetical protein EE612_057250 [Oryza sativa]
MMSRLIGDMQRHRRTLSTTVVEETIAAAATLVSKWHPDDHHSSLFLHASSPEADHFLRAAADLHRAMLFFASDPTNAHNGHGLVQAHHLLDTAMRRLQLELPRLLAPPPAGSRDRLRALADTMMSAGYGKECISTFKEHRRAALAATLRRQHTTVQVQLSKLTWEQVDDNIQSWLAAARIAFSSVFPAEKELCDTVFAGDASVGDAVFEDVANNQAANLLDVAEAAVARGAARRSGCSVCWTCTTLSPRSCPKSCRCSVTGQRWRSVAALLCSKPVRRRGERWPTWRWPSRRSRPRPRWPAAECTR